MISILNLSKNHKSRKIDKYAIESRIVDLLIRSFNNSAFRYVVRQINPYALSFKTLGEVEKAELSLAKHSNILLPKINMIFRGDSSSDRRRYNLPIVDDVAMIFTNDDEEPPFKIDIKVYPRSNGNDLVILNVLSPNLDPMVYIILFPHGDPGWEPKMIAEGFENSGRSKISMLQFKIAFSG
ncbi:uncharacterized protein LOC135924245 [Gordionus sp. m RMFG-2023]|uniref:uncharacterized protein LOC135924245 n=1 Tax=Gordionus sp. m RMFG-2023 TaxID=3053472 RepID=UPI0031FD44D2